MTTQELKSYINRVLGSGIRCLLPSYWWKRLFGLVVDKVDEDKEELNSRIEEVSTLVQKNTVYIPLEGEGGVLSDEMLRLNARAVESVKQIDDIVFVFDGEKRTRSAFLISSIGSQLRYFDGLLLKESVVYTNGEVTTTVIESIEGESYDDTEIRNELSNLTNEMIANEEVHAAAYNDLDSRLKDVSSLISGVAVTKEEFQEGIQSITNEMVENEEVTAAALNDLNTRLNEILTRLNNAGI